MNVSSDPVSLPEHRAAAASQAEAGPGFGPTAARRVFVAIWALLLGFQVLYLLHLGENLNYLGNSHAEADTLRSAEAYVAQGLGAHHGLPRILYGRRFPHDGTVKDHVDDQGAVVAGFRQGFPPEMVDRNEWVVTHCPPGADLINGLFARAFGLDPIWRLRLLPIAVGLLGLAAFFQAVSLVWGVERGAVIAIMVALLPMVSLWLPTLHYEGYAFALILLQTSLVLRRLWLSRRLAWWCPLALFLLGFFQGWLSWDHFFVVSLLAVPWWLLRRAARMGPPPLRLLLWMTAAPAAGFTLAHILHFCVVAADLHGWAAAFGEFHRTAAERGGVSGGRGWIGYAANAIYLYIRWFFKPTNRMFGPLFAMLLVLALAVVTFNVSALTLVARNGKSRWYAALAWPRSRSAAPALVAAFVVCSLWLIAMPQHVVGNSPLTVRHFATFYFLMAVVVACSFQIRREVTQKDGQWQAQPQD